MMNRFYRLPLKTMGRNRSTFVTLIFTIAVLSSVVSTVRVSAQESQLGNHIIITYDVSGSLEAPRHITYKAHERIERYVRTLILNGWNGSNVDSRDEAVRIEDNDPLIKNGLWSPESSWAAYYFGDAVTEKQVLTTDPPSEAQLRTIYPCKFGPEPSCACNDNNTLRSKLLELIHAKCQSIGAQYSAILWVYVSDDIAEEKEGGDDESRYWVTRLQAEYYLKPLFTFKVWRDRIYKEGNRRSSYIYIEVIRISSSAIPDDIISLFNQIIDLLENRKQETTGQNKYNEEIGGILNTIKIIEEFIRNIYKEGIEDISPDNIQKLNSFALELERYKQNIAGYGFDDNELVSMLERLQTELRKLITENVETKISRVENSIKILKGKVIEGDVSDSRKEEVKTRRGELTSIENLFRPIGFLEGDIEARIKGAYAELNEIENLIKSATEKSEEIKARESCIESLEAVEKDFRDLESDWEDKKIEKEEADNRHSKIRDEFSRVEKCLKDNDLLSIYEERYRTLKKEIDSFPPPPPGPGLPEFLIALVIIGGLIALGVFGYSKVTQPIMVEVGRYEFAEVMNAKSFYMRSSGERSRIYFGIVEGMNYYDVGAPNWFVQRAPYIFGMHLLRDNERVQRVSFGNPFAIEVGPEYKVELIVRRVSMKKTEKGESIPDMDGPVETKTKEDEIWR